MEQLVNHFTAQLAVLAPRVAGAVLVLIAFWAAASIVHRLTRRLEARAEGSRQDAIGFFGQTIRAALFVLGIVTALGTMGVQVAALIAGLGLTGFALGFAFRDVLSNLLAGLMLLFYRPFVRYDEIAVSGFEGRVLGVDLRYTTIQREEGDVLIPNSMLFTNPIAVRRRAVDHAPGAPGPGPAGLEGGVGARGNVGA